MAKKSEQSLMQKLHEMLPTQVKVYYIVWKYAPSLLPKKIDTFEELVEEYKGFTKGMDEAQCERWYSMMVRLLTTLKSWCTTPARFRPTC